MKLLNYFVTKMKQFTLKLESQPLKDEKWIFSFYPCINVQIALLSLKIQMYEICMESERLLLEVRNLPVNIHKLSLKWCNIYQMKNDFGFSTLLDPMEKTLGQLWHWSPHRVMSVSLSTVNKYIYIDCILHFFQGDI